MGLHKVWFLLRRAFTAWNDHDAPELGAALAFYTLLSLAPLLILVVAVVSIGVGHSAAEGHIIDQVQDMAGDTAADAVRGMLRTKNKPAANTLAAVVGMITLLFGASGVFVELRTALNKMWDVKRKETSGLWGLCKERLFSFGMVLAVGFLLLVSLVVSATLAALGKFGGSFLPAPPSVMTAINLVVSVLAISALFALIYKYVPDTHVQWREVWVGAVATGVFFTLGKYLIGLYIGKASIGSAYGAAGSLVVLIVWVYYSSLVFLFGAELTQLLRSNHRTPLPDRHP